jgi:hypothetical protein
MHKNKKTRTRSFIFPDGLTVGQLQTLQEKRCIRAPPWRSARANPPSQRFFASMAYARACCPEKDGRLASSNEPDVVTGSRSSSAFPHSPRQSAFRSGAHPGQWRLPFVEKEPASWERQKPFLAFPLPCL